MKDYADKTYLKSKPEPKGPAILGAVLFALAILLANYL
jgi:hypothetical protein